MVEGRLPRESTIERQGALIYADIVSRALYLIVDQLGPNADLAKKTIGEANSKIPNFTLAKQKHNPDSTLYYFSFVPSPCLPQNNTDEVLFSIGVAPLRDPLILIKEIREIKGKVYHIERALLTDKENRPIMSFWQASWEPKNKNSVPESLQVNIKDAGLPIVGLGTPIEQRLPREKAFERFIPPYQIS